MHVTQTLKLASAALALAVAAVASANPVDNTFDWTGSQRTLLLSFAASSNNYNLAGPALGTMTDAFQSAATIWNSANTGWNFRYNGDGAGAIPGGLPAITVRMGNLFAGGGGGAGPDDFAPPQGSLPPEIDGPGGGGGGGPGGLSSALAIFRTTSARVNDQFSSGEIVVNPLNGNLGIFWSYTNIGPGGAVLTFDPIIMAMHELGHVLRLDHNSPLINPANPGAGMNDTIQVGMESGPVMRPKLARGVHQVNPMLFGPDRRVSMEDVANATITFNTRVPTPGAAALLGLGALCIARRRRA
jgi:hypothetical protein